MPNANKYMNCPHCQHTAKTTAFYSHLVTAHTEETLRTANAKIASGQKLHKAEQVVLIGKNAKGKWTPIATHKTVINAMLRQRFEDRREVAQVQQDVVFVQHDVIQVQQDVIQIQANVVFVHDEVAQVKYDVEHIQEEVENIQDDVEHIHEEVAHLRHSFADVLEAFAELQRGQQEQQEHIRRVEGEQEAIRERQERQDRVLALLMQAQDIMNQRP